MKPKQFFSIFLIAIGVLLLSGCSFRGKPDGGVYKSTDGGSTFDQKITVGEKVSISNENILDLEIDKNNKDILYIGTASMGIMRSTNGGDNWVRAQNNFTNVEDVELNPNDSAEIYAAVVIGGRGKIMKTKNGGEEWSEVFTENLEGARVMSIAIDPKNTQIIYAGDTLGGIYKSYDGAATWQTLLWADSAVDKIEIDNVNTSKVYFMTRNSGIMRTDDAGVNFTETGESNKVFNVVAHPNRANVVYISNDKGLHRSENSGQTLNQINTLVKPEKLGSRGLAINPQNDNEIYFASGKAFYKTTNGGQTWKPVQFNTARTIEIIRVVPSNTEEIYVGTSKGPSSGLKLFPTL